MELVLSAVAGAGTLLGAAAVMLLGRLNHRTLAVVLGVAAGVMGGVVAGDLLPAALGYAGPPAVFLSLMAGIAAVAWGDVRLRGILRRGRDPFLKTGLLVGMGIALHDLLEGLAIAAGFAALPQLGLLMVAAIGLHNIPEGMATAAPLLAAGVRRRTVLAACAGLSLVTPLGTAVGLGITRMSPFSIAILSAAAAGAMLYVVLAELAPRAVSHHFGAGTGGLLTGISLVYLLVRILS
ncbi:MAG: ZIP family metal transporter [Desulfotomaculales bacterium]